MMAMSLQDVGVARVMDLYTVREFDHETTGLAAVNHLVAVLYAAGVIGMDHGDFYVADGLRAALVHLGKLLYTFLAQPSAQLGNADHGRVVLFGDFDGVTM